MTLPSAALIIQAPQTEISLEWVYKHNQEMGLLSCSQIMTKVLNGAEAAPQMCLSPTLSMARVSAKYFLKQSIM